jgi:hypothetical protein
VQAFRIYCIVLAGTTGANWAAIATTCTVCAYQTVLTVIYAFTRSVPRHRLITYHLFFIAIFLFFHVYVTTLGQYLANDTRVILTWIEYTLFGLTLLQVICAGSIPCTPPRHFDLKRMYNKAVAAAISKSEEDRARATVADETVGDRGEPQSNMNNEFSATILSQLILAWVVPVISKISKLDQADIQDIPGLHTDLTVHNTAVDAATYAWAKISPERWGVTRAFLWEVWAPQWRVALPGELTVRAKRNELTRQVWLSHSSSSRCGIFRTSPFSRSSPRSSRTTTGEQPLHGQSCSSSAKSQRVRSCLSSWACKRVQLAAPF